MPVAAVSTLPQALCQCVMPACWQAWVVNTMQRQQRTPTCRMSAFVQLLSGGVSSSRRRRGVGAALANAGVPVTHRQARHACSGVRRGSTAANGHKRQGRPLGRREPPARVAMAPQAAAHGAAAAAAGTRRHPPWRRHPRLRCEPVAIHACSPRVAHRRRPRASRQHPGGGAQGPAFAHA